MKSLALLTVLLSAVMAWHSLPLERALRFVSESAQSQGITGVLVGSVVYALSVVLMLPAAVLTLTAGVVLGPLLGTVTAFGGALLGATAAFGLSRWLGRPVASRHLSHHPWLHRLDRLMECRGWTAVVLLRANPAVPFTLSNYLLGLTSVKSARYITATAVGIIPGTTLYALSGHLGFRLLAGESSLLSLSAAALAFILLVIVAARALALAPDDPSEEPLRFRAECESLQPLERPVPVPCCWRFSARWGTLAAASLFGACWAQTPGSSLARLFGPPPVEMREAYADTAGGTQFDHSLFDALLRHHVDANGFVNYAALAQDASPLDAYVESLGTAPFERLGRDERLALLINAYNAFTLRLILDHWPIDSIMSIPAADRWDAQRWNVGGNVWSLNQIEHEQIRPRFAEPRVHFALVCAAVGCPPLRNEAYNAEHLDQQLEEQARYVHSHSHWFRFDADDGEVHLTSLYDWYGSDFEQSAGSVLDFAARYSSPLAEALGAGDSPRTVWIPYDWSLNNAAAEVVP